MQAGQTSRRGGIQDFLCPFTTMRITQGSNQEPTHEGTMSNDVAGATPGNRDNYYAPCDVKCIKTIYAYGESRWQSLEKVRFANGRIDYATFEIAHDDTINCKVGQVVKQGVQLGTMGTKGNATGVHCHIQISQSNDTRYYKNKYGRYQFNNEYDTDDCYFIDGTNDMSTVGNWKTLADVPVTQPLKSTDEIANEVIAGKWGNGNDRIVALEAAGYNYSEVQKRVNDLVNQPSTDLLSLVKRTMSGEFGNGQTRKDALGSNYDEVQKQVNLNLSHGTTSMDSIRLY